MGRLSILFVLLASATASFAFYIDDEVAKTRRSLDLSRDAVQWRRDENQNEDTRSFDLFNLFERAADDDTEADARAVVSSSSEEVGDDVPVPDVSSEEDDDDKTEDEEENRRNVDFLTRSVESNIKRLLGASLNERDAEEFAESVVNEALKDVKRDAESVIDEALNKVEQAEQKRDTIKRYLSGFAGFMDMKKRDVDDLADSVVAEVLSDVTDAEEKRDTEEKDLDALAKRYTHLLGNNQNYNSRNRGGNRLGYNRMGYSRGGMKREESKREVEKMRELRDLFLAHMKRMTE